MTPEASALYTSLIVAIPTMLAATVVPIVLRLLDMKAAKEKDDRDDKRQQAVAIKAQEAVDAAKQTGDDAAKLLKKNTAITVDASKSASDKLDVIHTLVNSKMTEALKSELDATKAQLVLMKEMVSIKKSMSQEPSPETLSAVDITEKKIAELSATLDDRMRQAKVVEDQQANQRSDAHADRS